VVVHGPVAIVLAGEVAVVVLGLVALVSHGLWETVSGRMHADRLDQGRSALLERLGGDAMDDPKPREQAALPRLSVSHQTALLAELQPSLTLSQRRELATIGRGPAVEARALRLVRSRRWRRRLRGARLLTLLGRGDEAMPALLEDPSPPVRTQAAEWAAEHPSPEVLAQLVEMLVVSDPATRFAVKDALLRIRHPALEQLIEALEGASGQAAARLLEVAQWLPDPRLSEAAIRLAGDPEDSTRAEAVRLLGAIGGAEAALVLDQALVDPAGAVRAAAATAHGRLGLWKSASRLAEMLRDESWDVRSAAGLALRALGGPGQLMLRRTLDDEDRFAREMAQHVLDLPGSIQGVPE
jgi:HEAT repeat protein